MKKQTKKSLKKKCDVLYSLIIRSKGYCEVCGKSNLILNAHHVIGRVNYSLRWDIRNGCCLCVSCHKFSKASAHEHPIKFINWFKKTRSEDHEYLLNKKNEIKTWTIFDYQEILKDLKDILNDRTN